jgi:hypothetical protein
MRFCTALNQGINNMTTIKQVAKAFASGNKAKCYNAETDGKSYWLHGNRIAYKKDDYVTADWCGYHTATTANHLNKIARAIGSQKRIGYATARLVDEKTFQF